MMPLYRYQTPDGFDDLLLRSDNEALTGLWFENSCDVKTRNSVSLHHKIPPVIHDTCRWLDIYFSGRQPDFTPTFRMDQLTPFRKAVMATVCDIPFGRTLTYGEIAKRLKTNSAQAVGGAVGWNPISIVVPCHRVVGANGNLVGYGGGMNNKIALLRLEGIGFAR